MKILFIVGVGRSGTSLLQSMFASNPFVSFISETGFIRRYLTKGVLEKLYVKRGMSGATLHLAQDKAFNRTGLDAEVLLGEAIKSRGLLDRAVYVKILNAYNADNAVYVGDKDPRLIEFLPLLASLFDCVEVLNIIRDPRDVLLSKKKAAWSAHGHVWKHIFANRMQLSLGRYWGPRLFYGNYHEVIYEDLISDPNTVLSQLCVKIGIPYDSAMLSFGIAAKTLTSDSELSWKKETFGPLLSNNKEKWRIGLSSKEIALTELCCRDAFAAGGYQLDEHNRLKLSWFDKAWVFLGAALIFIADRSYRYYRNFVVYQACKRNNQ